jgi:lysophospholipase
LTDKLLAQAKVARRDVPNDVVFDYFSSTDGQHIRFARFPASSVLEPKGTIIFVPGRTEFIEKFIEDVRIWNKLGFAAAAVDLRGQGMSYRPHPDRSKHFVDSFDPHLDDLKTLFEKALINKMPQPFILMGHSAGSHVILRFLKEHPGFADAGILIAPMVQVYTGSTPLWFLRFLAWTMQSIGLGAKYIPGHTEFKQGRWGWRRKLTHDDERFEDEDYFIQNKDSRLAVGGATYKWVLEAIRSCDKLNAPGYAEAITSPVLILQASEDKIVDNAAQNALSARLPHGNLVKIEGAMHEILKETDEHRAAVWRAIADFIDLKDGPDFSALPKD